MHRKSFKGGSFAQYFLAIWLVFFGENSLAANIFYYGIQEKKIGSLDPALANERSNYIISHPLHASLLQWNPTKKKLFPSLAKTWGISDDGRKLSFVLRDDIYFHNGRKIVAQDVAFSFQRILDPRIKSPFSSFFGNIKGSDSFAKGETESLAGIVLISDTAFEIHLSNPDAAFPQILAIWMSSIVPKEETIKSKFGHMPSGAGPYRIISRTDKTIMVVKFNKFPYSNPATPQIVTYLTGLSDIRLLSKASKKELDFARISHPSPTLIRKVNDHLYNKVLAKVDSLSTVYLSLNTRHGPLKNLELRKAVSMAIDKSAIVKKIHFTTVAATDYILPAGLRGSFNKKPAYSYDPEEAKQIIASLPKPDTLTIMTPDSKQNIRTVEMISHDLQKAGIESKLIFAEEAELLERANDADIDIVYSDGISWTAEYPDPSNFYYSLLAPEAYEHNYNWSGYADDNIHVEANSLNAMSKPEHDAQRRALWERLFDKIVRESVPIIPIFHRQEIIIGDLESETLKKLLKSGTNILTTPTDSHP